MWACLRFWRVVAWFGKSTRLEARGLGGFIGLDGETEKDGNIEPAEAVDENSDGSRNGKEKSNGARRASAD